MILFSLSLLTGCLNGVMGDAVKEPETKLSRWNIFKKLGCNQPKPVTGDEATCKPEKPSPEPTSTSCESSLIETITTYATTTATIPQEPCCCVKEAGKKGKGAATGTTASFSIIIPQKSVCSVCDKEKEHSIVYVSSTSTLYQVHTVTQEIETSTIIKYVTKAKTSTITVQCSTSECKLPPVVCNCTCTQKPPAKERNLK